MPPKNTFYSNGNRKQQTLQQTARHHHVAKKKRRVSTQPRSTYTAKQLIRRKADTEIIKRRRLQAQIRKDKPILRGWQHLLAFPLVIACSVMLIILAPGGIMKVMMSIYAATAILLFGNSAALHIGDGYWSKKVYFLLCKIDYSNIFLIIAGTCSPFLFAMNHDTLAWVYFGVIWGVAIAGTICHLIWYKGKDWIFSMVYIVLGLAPVTILYWFWTSPNIGPVATILVVAGGACYIAGAVVFANRRPNPFPRIFGYHEIFHLGTVLGYSCHVVALFLVVLQMRGLM